MQGLLDMLLPPGTPMGMPPAMGGGPSMPQGLQGLLDSFMAMRARNGQRGYGPTMQATTFGSPLDSLVPGGAMDMQESAARGLPLAVEAFGPPGAGRAIPGADMDMEMAAAMRGPQVSPNASGDSVEQGGPVQADGETVPMPRPRPAAADTDFSSGMPRGGVPGAPMSLAPPMPGPSMPPGGMPRGMPPMGRGGADDGMSAALLLAMAGGFAGAPTIGQGMRRAFSAAAPVMMQDEARRTKRGDLESSYKDLVALGVPPQLAMAAVRNPAVMKEVSERFGTPKAPTAPTIQEFQTDQGKVKRQYNPATGAWEDIPGTTADPGDKRHRLSVTDVKKLSEDTRKLQAIDRYSGGFKDEYAGHLITGDIPNWIGRHVAGAPGSLKDAANWWQDYSQYRNAVRHELFGSALTAPERSAFLESDITPRMAPDMIRRNLARQQEIVRNALKREGSALIAEGHKKAAIAAAYGVDPSFFDGDEAPAAPAAPTAPRSVTVGGKKVPYRIVP